MIKKLEIIEQDISWNSIFWSSTSSILWNSERVSQVLTIRVWLGSSKFGDDNHYGSFFRVRSVQILHVELPSWNWAHVSIPAWNEPKLFGDRCHQGSSNHRLLLFTDPWNVSRAPRSYLEISRSAQGAISRMRPAQCLSHCQIRIRPSSRMGDITTPSTSSRISVSYWSRLFLII